MRRRETAQLVVHTRRQFVGARCRARHISLLYPFRGTPRRNPISLAEVHHPRGVFAPRELIAKEPLSQTSNLMAIEIAHELVDERRGRLCRWTDAMCQQRIEYLGAIPIAVALTH
jgi:hypothetical protein